MAGSAPSNAVSGIIYQCVRKTHGEAARAPRTPSARTCAMCRPRQPSDPSDRDVSGRATRTSDSQMGVVRGLGRDILDSSAGRSSSAQGEGGRSRGGVALRSRRGSRSLARRSANSSRFQSGKRKPAHGCEAAGSWPASIFSLPAKSASASRRSPVPVSRHPGEFLGVRNLWTRGSRNVPQGFATRDRRGVPCRVQLT